MARKKFSVILFQIRSSLDLSPEEMAFILGITQQMYKRYERGDWDKTYSIRKQRLLNKINSLDIEIEKKILMLKATLRKFGHYNSVKKSGKTFRSNGHNLHEKTRK